MDLAAATVVTAEAVEWSDGSLGCPEPGMMYTQAITPGYHVVISVGGVEYDYRATDAGQVRLCQDAGPARRLGTRTANEDRAEAEGPDPVGSLVIRCGARRAPHPRVSPRS